MPSKDGWRFFEARRVSDSLSDQTAGCTAARRRRSEHTPGCPSGRLTRPSCIASFSLPRSLPLTRSHVCCSRLLANNEKLGAELAVYCETVIPCEVSRNGTWSLTHPAAPCAELRTLIEGGRLQIHGEESVRKPYYRKI